MESLTSGTLAGTGSFQCEECGYVVTLAAGEEIPACPSCSSRSFARASLFAAGRFAATELAPADDALQTLTAEARGLAVPGPQLAIRSGDTVQAFPLSTGTTRVGRSLAAEIRFDDPTVSRRHALIVRENDSIFLLDDRSLNGVFVNGERVEKRELRDGDEIVLGRHRLVFLVGERSGWTAHGAPLEAAGA